MKEFLEIMQTWSGIFLLLVLAVIGIILSLAGSSSGEERRLGGSDDDHYVLRLPIGRVIYPLILLVVGAVLEFVCNYVQDRFFPDMTWPFFAGKMAIGLIFGLLFWTQLAKVLRSRVFVNGDKIIVTPAIGAPIETNFKQIRTVANKHAGRDRGVIGKKIRTKEGNRFEVINTMAGYERFCIQLEEKVELPNLTKKLFKKRDKKTETEKEPEEIVSQEPLPQASPVAVMHEKPFGKHAETSAAGSYYHEDRPGSYAEPAIQESEEAAEPEIQSPEPEETFAEELPEVTVEDTPAEEPEAEYAEEDAAPEDAAPEDAAAEEFDAEEPAEETDTEGAAEDGDGEEAELSGDESQDTVQQDVVP